MTERVVYIGTPDSTAAEFERRARADFPSLALTACDDRRAARASAAAATVFIGHHFQFDDDLLKGAPGLRWIQSLTTGTDAIVKLASLRPEVILTSARGIHGPQMSELVFLQMLSLLRDFPRLQRNQAAARWERWPQPLLQGRSVVIVGVGAIAEALAPRCQAFGMRVFGVSQAVRIPPGFEAVFPRAELPRAASLADFLVLIVPHSPRTEKLVDAKVLAAMRADAFLVNVARGGVLDEAALVRALREKRLAGAALDVFRTTPLPADDPLWREPGVILTPNIGGMSDVYLAQAYPLVRDNLRAFLAGNQAAMSNVVPH